MKVEFYYKFKITKGYNTFFYQRFCWKISNAYQSELLEIVERKDFNYRIECLDKIRHWGIKFIFKPIKSRNLFEHYNYFHIYFLGKHIPLLNIVIVMLLLIYIYKLERFEKL